MKSLLLFVLALGGCAAPRAYTNLTEQMADPGLSRYENKEAVCLIYTDKQDKSSLQCKWKTGK